MGSHFLYGIVFFVNFLQGTFIAFMKGTWYSLKLDASNCITKTHHRLSNEDFLKIQIAELRFKNIKVSSPH